MGARHFLWVISLLCALATVGFAAATPGAAATPSPRASAADPCATAVPDEPNDVSAAFGYELALPDLLHFLSALATVPPVEQKRAFDTAADAFDSPDERNAADADAPLCENLDEIYATTRALALVANHWKLGEIDDPKRFQAFSGVVKTALWTLSAGSRVTPEVRAAALRPFHDLDVPASPSPAASAPLDCAGAVAAARPIRTVPPNYPPLAYVAGTSGDILILVSLSEDGEVRSAHVFRDQLHDRLGSDAIRQAAIFSAAATTYTPGRNDCRPVAGKYIMVIKFARR